MSESGFEKTNLGWQVQQLQQQFWEGVELTLFRNKPNLPNVSLPSWSIDLLWPLIKAASWLIIGLAVAWLLWQAWLVLRPYIDSLDFEFGSQKGKPLPESEMVTGDWLGRSQQFYAQGNYGEAARCLYMAMLQRLHDTGIIPHQPSRTDGEYEQLTETLSDRESYLVLLTVHEDLCFGNAEIRSEDFDSCQQAYRKIELK